MKVIKASRIYSRFSQYWVIAEVLKDAGQAVDKIEKWMMAEMWGTRGGRQLLTMGRGSSWQVDDLHLRMRSEISEMEESRKEEEECASRRDSGTRTSEKHNEVLPLFPVRQWPLSD